MNKKQELFFDITNGALGLILLFTGAAAIYGHLWLVEFESVPGSEMAVLLADSVAAEKERMETFRLLGGMSYVVTLSLTAVIGSKYYALHDDAKWEIQKGLAGGFILFVIAIPLYVFSSDLLPEAIWLSAALFGVIATVGNSILLITID